MLFEKFLLTIIEEVKFQKEFLAWENEWEGNRSNITKRAALRIEPAGKQASTCRPGSRFNSHEIGMRYLSNFPRYEYKTQGGCNPLVGRDDTRIRWVSKKKKY